MIPLSTKDREISARELREQAERLRAAAHELELLANRLHQHEAPTMLTVRFAGLDKDGNPASRHDSDGGLELADVTDACAGFGVRADCFDASGRLVAKVDAQGNVRRMPDGPDVLVPQLAGPPTFVAVHASDADTAIAARTIRGFTFAGGSTLPALARDVVLQQEGRAAFGADGDGCVLACEPLPRRLTDEEQEAWCEALAAAPWPEEEGAR